MPALPPERFGTSKPGAGPRRGQSGAEQHPGQPSGRPGPGLRAGQPNTAGDQRGPRRGRPACPPPAESRPLPDPAVVEMFLIPDSAPPYDGDAPADGSAAPTPRVSWDDSRQRRAGTPDRGSAPHWPSHFAQVLAETLAGSRPVRQMAPWTTEHVRDRIQRLGAQMDTTQRPRVLRVVTCRPAADAVEMTVVISLGPRVRALAVRLERDGSAAARRRPDAAVPRWLCTAIEAA